MENNENKDLQNFNNEDTNEQNANEIPSESEKITVKDTIISLISMIVFIAVIIIAFSSGCISCTACGDNDNRLIVYADGTDDYGVEYISCVGPAGCMGFGVNSKCWPTECTFVKKSLSNNESISGCVTYYNKTGCIANTDVKSEGIYAQNTSCLGIICSGERYYETIAESAKAKEQNTCLGVGCGNAVGVDVRYYNEFMPRKFRTGCWGNE